jgi:hypothetical protein
MRHVVVLLVASISLATACGTSSQSDDDATPAETPTSTPPTSAIPTSTSPSSSPSAPMSPSPTPDDAVVITTETATRARDLDVADLAPDGTDVTGRWTGASGGDEVLLVAVAGHGDAFSRDRALWRWTPAPDLGGWLGITIATYPARRGVLNLDATVADVTGDGNDDALVSALTGGTGACATWSVVDLADAERIFVRDLCDGSIDPSAEPVGLVVTESVFRADDPHCCPSARRETVLTYAGGSDWNVDRRETTSF